LGGEKHIADLTVAHDPGAAYDGIVDQVDAIDPSMMPGDRAEAAD
jgi:hypothetical protein